MANPCHMPMQYVTEPHFFPNINLICPRLKCNLLLAPLKLTLNIIILIGSSIFVIGSMPVSDWIMLNIIFLIGSSIFVIGSMPVSDWIMLNIIFLIGRSTFVIGLRLILDWLTLNIIFLIGQSIFVIGLLAMIGSYLRVRL
jgi:hypothetical protein